MCEVTESKAYQINWAIGHLPTRNTFISLTAPVFEHNFEVIFSPEEEDNLEDKYFTNQFSKRNGQWMIVDYAGEICDFCKGSVCESLQYKDKLEGMLEAVAIMEGRLNEKRCIMYRRFTALKYGGLGRGVRRKLDGCIQDLILRRFPVDAGKRKRGFKEVTVVKFTQHRRGTIYYILRILLLYGDWVIPGIHIHKIHYIHTYIFLKY